LQEEFKKQAIDFKGHKYSRSIIRVKKGALEEQALFAADELQIKIP
jgi:hypothetical protein